MVRSVTKRGCLVRGGVGVVIFILSLLLFEWIGSVVLRNRLAHRYELTVDHRLVPHSTPEINSDGIRCLREAGDYDHGTFNIIFLGDSFTYGLKLESLDQAFPAVIEGRLTRPELPVMTANFGWLSSSPLLSERLLCDIGSSYAPDLVVLCLDMTDFHDDLKYDRSLDLPRISATAFLLRKLNFHWILSDWSEASWWPWRDDRMPLPAGFFIVNQPLAESRPYLEVIERSILGIDRRCREDLGADFAVVMPPRSFQYENAECPNNWEARNYTRQGPWVREPFLWFQDFAAASGIPCYSLLDAFVENEIFPICFDSDPHWTAAGHQVAANAIIEVLREGGHLPSP